MDPRPQGMTGMQITPTSSINTISATGLRELNATPVLSFPQTVVATVMTSRAVPGATQSFEGQLLLEKQLISFLTSYPLKEGQEVSVRQTADGNFRLLDVRAPTLSTSVEQLIRQVLPQTQSGAFAQLISSLRLITQQNPKVLPEKAHWAAAQLLQQIPVVDAPEASHAIREWVQRQATPAEHHLARGATPDSLKQQPASLLQSLVSALEAAEPSLKTRTASSGTTENKPDSARPSSGEPLTYSPKDLQSRQAVPRQPVASASLQALLQLLRPVFSQTPGTTSEEAVPQAPAPTLTAGTTSHGEANLQARRLPHGGFIPERTALFQRLHEQAQAVLVGHQMERVLSAFEQQTQQPLPTTFMPFPADGQNVLMFLTLPVQHAQGESEVHLQIGERGARENEDGKKEWHWVISLGFEIEGLGRLGVRAELSDDHLSGDVWAEQGSTSELVSEHLPLLRERLGGLGLVVDRMDSHLGLPADSTDTRLSLSLVDTRA